MILCIIVYVLLFQFGLVGRLTWVKTYVNSILELYTGEKTEQRDRLFKESNGTEIRQPIALKQGGQRSIPKIIHQIWNDEIVPTQFVKNVQSLVRDNAPPDWKYYFWTKESGLKFIQEKYPALYQITTSEYFYL